jgi:hypothetical protein
MHAKAWATTASGVTIFDSIMREKEAFMRVITDSNETIGPDIGDGPISLAYGADASPTE